MNIPPLRILISRPDRIGDVVLSTPLPREIKRKYPNSHIALLLKPYTKDIYLNNPYVDDVISLNDQSDFYSELSIVRKIREYRFTHAFMLLPSIRVNRILLLAGIKERYGVGHRLFQFISNTKSIYRNKYNPLRHESDYCLDFIRKIGIEPEDISSEIYLSEAERTSVMQIKENFSEDKYIVGINTTSGNSAPNWALPDYISLIKNLSDNQKIRLVVTDNNIPTGLEHSGLLFPNRGKPLRESILNFAALDVLVSASTGPMHICAGLKVPTVSLFCPLTACSPKLWGPLGNRNSILLPQDDYCTNHCPGDPKQCTFFGEGGITPQMVEREVYKILGISG